LVKEQEDIQDPGVSTFADAVSETLYDDSAKSDLADAIGAVYGPDSIRKIVGFFNEYADQKVTSDGSVKSIYRVLHNQISRYYVEELANKISQFKPERFRKLVAILRGDEA
jgi:hypothetical protein